MNKEKKHKITIRVLEFLILSYAALQVGTFLLLNTNPCNFGWILSGRNCMASLSDVQRFMYEYQAFIWLIASIAFVLAAFYGIRYLDVYIFKIREKK